MAADFMYVTEWLINYNNTIDITVEPRLSGSLLSGISIIWLGNFL